MLRSESIAWRPACCLALGLLLSVGGSACGDKPRKGKPVTKAQARDLRKQGSLCFDQGDYGCAMTSLSKVLKAQPKNAELLNAFAMAARMRYYQSGDMDFRDQELEALRKAVKLSAADATIQVNFATTAWELGMRKEAAKAYTRALELLPKHPDAVLIRGRIKRSTVEVEEE